MPTATEETVTPDLTGSPRNPAREPRKNRPRDGKGSLGDQALMDAITVVVIAWIVLLLLAYSLRHHNV